MKFCLFLGFLLVASDAADALRIVTRVERRQREISVPNDESLLAANLHRRATSSGELAFPDNL